MKIVTQQMIEERISSKWPEEPFKIISYEKVSKPFTIQCLQCNNSTTYSTFNNFIGAKKEHWCKCRQTNNQAKHLQNKEKIQEFFLNNPTKDFIDFSYEEKDQKHRVKFLCKKCNQEVTKTFQSFFKNNECPFCENREQLNTQAVKSLLPAEFELLEEYKNEKTKVLVRHSCGFTWPVLTRTIIAGKTGCPKCNRRRSKGEQKIAKWLADKGLLFEEEKIFNWQTNSRCRYDFYVPSVDLIIEYMGEQHFKECPGWLKDSLQERQYRDKIKKEDALREKMNYLAISYVDFNNIEQILNDWFNDYPLMGVDSSESKEKVSSNEDKNIV